MDRRKFFKISSVSGGGLLLSTYIPFSCSTPKKTLPDWQPNFFLRISPDNVITLISSQSEIGQGTSTGLAMIAADELGVKLENIKIEFAAGSAERYEHLQDTGGSNGLRMLWKPLREAAAITREILKQAAAQNWNTPIDNLYSENGFIHNKTTKEKMAFGALLEIAAQLPAPRKVTLKNKKDFKYIGRPISGTKNRLIARGQNPYSINIKLPGMLYAAIERCPVWGGKVVSFNAEKAKAFPGVVEVIEMEGSKVQNFDYKGGVRSGVAVLAENTWAAFQAKKLLAIEWDLGDNAKVSNTEYKESLARRRSKSSGKGFDYKNGKALYKKGSFTIDAVYESPFQANACMEPLNSVAYHKGHQVEIWAGTQAPKLTQEHIAEFTKLPKAAITVHNQPSGGGFGRRYFCDFVEEAVYLSEKVRQPVKVTWSREDTIHTSKYHPYCIEYWSAALNQNNYPIALSYQGVVSRPSGFRPFPYGLPTAFGESLFYGDGSLLPRASWRSVAAHPWGLGLESFIDELAHNARIDPIEFRINLLAKAEVMKQKFDPWVGDDLYPEKLKKTLEIAAEKADWGKRSNGVFQGVSAICYNTSYCTQIADISVNNGKIKIHKITAVMDCGIAVNPSQVKAQVEGSIVWGLSALLKEPIKVNKGAVVQQNFDTYDLLRINEAPEVEVYIVDSQDHPSGTGEPAVPGVAPAVLNAIFAATGKRIRKLPVLAEDLETT